MANSKTIATMKKLFTKLMLVAVAAMGITACQNEPTEINVNAKKVTVEVIGELDATRSSFGDFVENGDADYYPSKWDGGEQVVFSLNEAALVTADNTGTGSKATFSVGLTDDKTTEGAIYAFSPKGNYSTGKGGFTGIKASEKYLYVVVPTEQNPSTTSVDPAVHLLAGKATYDNGLPSSIKMKFNHAAAYGRMEITNFGEEITKVKITASSPLAGTSCHYYYADYADAQEGQLTNADQTTITINNPAADNKVFWFGCAPADLSEGTLEVKVYTADASYTKSINFASKDLKRGFAFVQGEVANFLVNMSDVAKDVVDETSYALVTSLADIEDGQYIIAGYDSANNKYYALPNAAKTTAGRIAGTQVTVTDNLVSGVGAEDYMWTFTKSGDKFTITNGEYYFDQSGSSNTSLKVTTTEATWSIETSSVAGCFKLVPDAATSRMLLFRVVEDDYGNNLEFGAYAFSNETKSDYSSIFLFKYGGTYKPALATPVVTAAAEGNTITVSWGAVEGAKDYTVSCDGFDDKTVTGTSVTYTELEYSNTYNFSVVANPTDTENKTASNPGTASATTEADPNAAAPTSGYKLIKTMAEFTTGEYVIVGTNGTSNYAMPNKSTSNKPTATLVTIVDDVISTANASGFVWTITVTGTNCTIYNGSSYLGYSTSGTDFSKKDSAYNWAVSVVDNLFKIVPNSGTTRAILYRTTGVFAPYAFSQVGNEYKYVSLYKKIENAGDGDEPATPVQLDTPTNVTASNITESSATISWTAVDNAKGYTVTYNGATKDVDTNSCELTGLTANKDYSVTVVAKGDGGVYYNDSAASEVCEFTTLKAASGGDTTSGWVRVTSTDMILSGGTFIIGYEATAKSGQIVPMRSDATGAKTTANGYHYSGTSSGTTSNNSTIDMNTITDTSKYQVTITTSTTVSGAINIQLPNGNYIGANNSKNTARLYSSAGANTAYGVSIGANDVVTLKCAAAATYHTLQYNVGSPRFANYNGGQKNLVLYKLQ